MKGRIHGSFPGGPRKSVPAAERTTAPRLECVEQIEAGIAQRQVRQKRRARLKRMLYGFVLAAGVAVGAGFYMGFKSRTTVEQLRAEAEAAQAEQGMSELSTEVNRTLLELRKMEELEFARNSRGR